MEIRENDYTCIIAPLSKKLSTRETQRLMKEISSDNRRVAIDLSYVTECTYDFIDNIKELSKNKTISFFNIPSDLFVLFNIMNLDKTTKVYVNEIDFLSDTRQIINRNFVVV